MTSPALVSPRTQQRIANTLRVTTGLVILVLLLPLDFWRLMCALVMIEALLWLGYWVEIAHDREVTEEWEQGLAAGTATAETAETMDTAEIRVEE